MHTNRPVVDQPSYPAFKVETQGNYRDLNGMWLKLREIHSTRVSAWIYDDEVDRAIVVDFTLKEVTQFNYITF